MARKIRKGITPEGLKPRMSYSPGVKAGPWVFVAGKTAGNFSEHGLAPEARLDLESLSLQPSPLRVQALSILPNLGKVLAAGGSSFDRTVRVDDFVVTESDFYGPTESISDYLRTREEFFPEGAGLPASTLVGCSRLLCKPTILEIDCIGVSQDSGWHREIIGSPGLANPQLGQHHAVKVGPYVFCSGVLATDGGQEKSPGGQASKGTWLEDEMNRQTRFILDTLAETLDQAGSSLDLCAKAQVYLTAEGMKQVWKLDEVWKEYFPKDPPARCITPTEKLRHEECLVEINLVAVAKDGGIKPQTVNARGVPKWPLHEPHAVKAGNLLFLSTGIASDDKGHLAKECRVNPFYPWYEKGIRKQMDFILGNAEKIVKAAGGKGYDNIVRRQAFHSDFDEFILSFEVWRSKFPADPPVSTTIEDCNVPLPVQGATLVLDLWAYLP